MREALKAGLRQESEPGLLLTLKAYELEARNMEERILLLSGHQHVPLGGMLMQVSPIIEIADHSRAS
jgi:hypothetical protein